jgi:hypothetical protein
MKTLTKMHLATATDEVVARLKHDWEGEVQSVVRPLNI